MTSMPFKSRSQMRAIFAKDADMGREWAAETPDIGSLPERVGSGKKLRSLGIGKRASRRMAFSLKGSGVGRKAASRMKGHGGM